MEFEPDEMIVSAINRIIFGAGVVIFGPILLFISPALVVFWAIGRAFPEVEFGQQRRRSRSARHETVSPAPPRRI